MGTQGFNSWSFAQTEPEPPQFSEGDDVLEERAGLAADAAEKPEATPSPNT